MPTSQMQLGTSRALNSYYSITAARSAACAAKAAPKSAKLILVITVTATRTFCSAKTRPWARRRVMRRFVAIIAQKIRQCKPIALHSAGPAGQCRYFSPRSSPPKCRPPAPLAVGRPDPGRWAHAAGQAAGAGCPGAARAQRSPQPIIGFPAYRHRKTAFADCPARHPDPSHGRTTQQHKMRPAGY